MRRRRSVSRPPIAVARRLLLLHLLHLIRHDIDVWLTLIARHGLPPLLRNPTHESSFVLSLQLFSLQKGLQFLSNKRDLTHKRGRNAKQLLAVQRIRASIREHLRLVVHHSYEHSQPLGRERLSKGVDAGGRISFAVSDHEVLAGLSSQLRSLQRTDVIRPPLIARHVLPFLLRVEAREALLGLHWIFLARQQRRRNLKQLLAIHESRDLFKPVEQRCLGVQHDGQLTQPLEREIRIVDLLLYHITMAFLDGVEDVVLPGGLLLVGRPIARMLHLTPFRGLECFPE